MNSNGSTVLKVPNSNDVKRLEKLAKLLEDKGIEATIINHLGMEIIDNGQFLATIKGAKLFFLEYPSSNTEFPDKYFLEARLELNLDLEMPNDLRRLYPEPLLRSALIVYVKNR